MEALGHRLWLIALQRTQMWRIASQMPYKLLGMRRQGRDAAGTKRQVSKGPRIAKRNCADRPSLT
ncbi:hypothetical protein GCM10007036_36270 [Alsobacter metallidurans]|uniref:Uncharacterized protein n=1 Tax=Alsobacter metallidurans TaxID=340221 RepID=A0A917I9Z4_9HYPH|nr:hypothetical protein GCM10007036_36270 [Alsobacter metallidurans]